MNRGRPPVIVLGMHRSGTSMVCRLLDQLGLYLGWLKDPTNHEAYFFYLINEWLLRQCGASWDHPEPARLMTSNGSFCASAVQYLRFVLRSRFALTYLGPRHCWRCRGPADLRSPWGWKDPRNTLTLPLWLDVFPEAKVIHVYRHGVDVAVSLKKRHEAELAAASERCMPVRTWHRIWPLASRITHTLRCARLEEAFNLWRHYVAAAKAHVAHLEEQAMAVCYEDLLARPEEHLRKMATFARLSAVSDQDITHAAQTVRRGRAYAYRQEASLLDFAQSRAGCLAKFGYEATVEERAPQSCK